MNNLIPANKTQKQAIAILTKGDRELKAALVELHTGDAAKRSTNDLSHTQANLIIIKLGGKPVVYDNWAFFDKNDKKHRTIISYAISYGWSVKNARYGEIADLYRLSEWLKSQRSPVQKPLLKMNDAELSKVISALDNMVKKKYK